MKKKFKLFATIASISMSLALMVFGVIAATSVNVTISSNVSYTAEGVAFKLYGKSELASSQPTGPATDLTDESADTVISVGVTNAGTDQMTLPAQTFTADNTWVVYTFTVENNPSRPEDGTREVSFSRHLYIEAEDFLETPVPKYKRLYPEGPECRLKGAYLIKCTGCVKDENGNVVEVLCEYDPESRGGDPADGRKVKGATIHWVDAATAVDAEIRLYDNLFSDADPDAGDKNFLDCLNPGSLEVLSGAKVEASLADAAAPASFQFLRQGYFCVDNRDSKPGHLVFNRSVSQKDSFKF